MSKPPPFPDFLRTADDPAGADIEAPLPAVCFHHQPKTAGSTFRKILASRFDEEAVCPAEIDDELVALTDEERRAYRLYAGHFKFDTIAAQLPDALWLTLLRHPVDRVVSNFYNLKSPDRYRPQWIERAEARPEVQRFLEVVQKMTLEDFVNSDEPRAQDRVINRQTRYLVQRTEKVKSCPIFDQQIVEEAQRNLRERFVYVGVQEHFDLSLQLLLMTFGLDPLENPEQYTANVGEVGKRNGRYDLPEHVREAIEQRNPMDLQLWRFAEQLMFQRLKRFQDYFIESDYVLRQELGVTRLPRFQDPIQEVIGELRTLGKRLPQPIKRMVGRGVPKD